MKTRNIKSAGVLLLGILMITAVNAQSPRHGQRGYTPRGAAHGPAYGMRYNQDTTRQYGRMNHADWLDLSEDQQAKITALRTEHSKTMTPLKNKMAELKARERTLLSEENIDMKEVNSTIDEQTDLMNKIRKLQVEQQVAMKSILTDEQAMKLQQGRDFAGRDGLYRQGGHRGNGMGRGFGKI
jgi:Spy/CpxP family protein refolding chaperone